MKNYFLIIIYLLITTIGYSQVNFKPGYIVLTSGDTLFTKIKYLTYNQMYEDLVCLDSLGNEIKMNIKTVTMYKRDTVEFYKFIVNGKKKGYFRLIQSGSINLYEHKFNHNISNYDKLGSNSSEYNFPEASEMIENSMTPIGIVYILKKGNYLSKTITKENFESMVGAYIVDDNEVFNKFMENKKYMNIEAIVDLYNKRHTK
jgi:hypothetical protein